MPKKERQPDTGSDREESMSPQSEPKSEEEREHQRKIAIAAYYKAEQRAFEPGNELEDWLEAERELDRGA